MFDTITEKLARARHRGASALRPRRGPPPPPLRGRAFPALLLGVALFTTSAAAYRESPERITADTVTVTGDPAPQTGTVVAPRPEAEQPAPAIDPELVEAMSGLISAGRAGKWLLAAMLALKLVIAGLRLAAKKLPPSKFTALLTSKWGGWALNFFGSQAGAFALAAGTGTLTVDTALALLFAGITTSLAAAGTRELVNDLKPAQAAGLAAAADPGKSLGA